MNNQIRTVKYDNINSLTAELWLHNSVGLRYAVFMEDSEFLCVTAI